MYVAICYMHFQCSGGCGSMVLSFLLLETQKRSVEKQDANSCSNAEEN